VSVWLRAALEAGVPAFVAGFIWLLSGRIRSLHRFGWLLSPLAIGAGYLVAHILLNRGVPPFPPTDSTHWLFYFALLGIGLGWLAELPADYRWLWGSLGLLSLGWLMVLGFKPLLESGYWAPWSGARIILLLTLATWLLMVLAAPMGEQERGAGLPFLLATLGGLSAGLIFYNKSALLGQLAGSLGAVLGMGVLMSWVMRGFQLGRGAVALALLLMALLWSMTYGYAELPAHFLALLYLTGVSLGISRLKSLTRLHPITLFTLRLLLLLLLTGIPLLLSYQTYMARQQEYPY
jgi:hypothetical protein